ncbi:MAG: carboxypeptidase regulatory-like domain-containing protein [bacterium]|nr:carboxypeptidase regulatory-like domain-containing protein [bacterium]
MKKLTYIFLFLTIVGFSQKGEKDNVFTNAGDAARMATAKQKLYAEDYVQAMNIFREVEKNNPGDASVKYYIGLCYFNLKLYDFAKASLLKATEINKGVKPETHLLLGEIYQMEENYDLALTELNTFTSSSVTLEKELVNDAELHASQCSTAKTLLANPVDVTITNLGSGINSKYDDKNPCITADGSQLVFTTRRPETTSSEVDYEGDGKHYENIYIAGIDSSTGNFAHAAGVSGSINTKAHDACTSISADGKQIFIYYNDNRDKLKRGGNIFVSKVTNGKWKVPVSLGKPINTSYWEGGACVSPDGKKYFFSSERPGGYGKSDIWMVERVRKSEWGEPVNLGAEINSGHDEGGMFLAPDGKTLFFCSNGSNSMGNYDIFKTSFENGKWSSPVNLGYPINTAAKEGQLTLSADAKFAYLSSDRKGGLGENDIYKIDLKEFAILEKDSRKKNSNGLSILRGTLRDGVEGYVIPDAEVAVNDAKGSTISSTTTNENGEYFLTLHGANYVLVIRKKGYQEINEPIEVGVSTKETIIVEKGYLLKR